MLTASASWGSRSWDVNALVASVASEYSSALWYCSMSNGALRPRDLNQAHSWERRAFVPGTAGAIFGTVSASIRGF